MTRAGTSVVEYEPETVERLIDRAVGGSEDRAPAFYAVAGSHVYGFPSEASGDVDVRGFHVVDSGRYALLDRPDEQIVVNQDGVTAGFEEFAHLDLVSYELRKFGLLVAEANFNVLEVVCCGEPVVDGVPEAMRSLHSLVADHLPLDVPSSYVGMATHNYRKRLEPERDGYEPTAKRYLYVLRGLLAARYVAAETAIEADVRVLADAVLGETDLVDDLIAVKRSDGELSDELADRADERIATLLETADAPERVEKTAFRDDVDDWMRTVRERVSR